MPITLDEKKALVAGFLGKCNGYADRKLAEYQTELAVASGALALELKAKISDWTAYRAFNEHAIQELGGDTLDDWFCDTSEK